MPEQQQATQNPPTFGRYGEIPPNEFTPKQKEAYTTSFKSVACVRVLIGYGFRTRIC
jgi:hypothetical protein